MKKLPIVWESRQLSKKIKQIFGVKFGNVTNAYLDSTNEQTNAFEQTREIHMGSRITNQLNLNLQEKGNRKIHVEPQNKTIVIPCPGYQVTSSIILP
jgi:hypothetical protein